MIDPAASIPSARATVPEMSFQGLLDALDGIAWLVDRRGTILACGAPNWSRFAAQNDGGDIADPATVVGRQMFDLIQGDDVRAFYRRIMDDVGAGARTSVTLPTTCEASDVGREMRMTVSRVAHGNAARGEAPHAILFQSVTLAEHQRPPVNLFDFRALLAELELDRHLPILTMCSICQKVRLPVGSDEAIGEWCPADEHYRRGGSSRVRISHGICPRCQHLLFPHDDAIG